MSIKKKGASLAFTASLIATLLTFSGASTALGAYTLVSAGTVGRSTTSAGTASETLTENSIAAFTGYNPPPGSFGTITQHCVDSAGGETISFVAPAITSAPGSLGASLILSSTGGGTNNVLTVKMAGHDDANVEQIILSFKVAATAVAPNGAIKCYFAPGLTPPVGGPAVPQELAVIPPLAATVTATGTLAASHPATTTGWTISLAPGSCPFEQTNAANGGTFPEGDAPSAGKLAFAVAPESIAIADDSLDTPVAGVQSVTLVAGGTANAHSAGEAVSQTAVPNCAVIAFPFLKTGTIGTVGPVLLNHPNETVGPTQVLPGQNNQVAGTDELSDGTFAADATNLNGLTVTFAITTPGVVFSAAPPVTYESDAAGPATCTLSLDRTNCSVGPLTDGPAVGGAVEIAPLVDVTAAVPLGTPVAITKTTSPTFAVVGNPGVVAFVGRVIVGAAAPTTIIIGFNAQKLAVISLKESGPGFFQSGLGSNNTFAKCIETGEIFTRAPWAVVTAGDLKLLNPATATGVTQVQGTLYNGNSCVYWTVFTGSTAASTIELRGGDASGPLATGPEVNVPVGLAAGTEQDAILVGTNAAVVASGGCASVAGCAAIPAFAGAVAAANRVFNGQIIVAAVSQPRIAPGSIDALKGDITLTETGTLSGQFKLGQTITVTLNQASSALHNEVFINTANTNDLPLIKTNAAASGLLTSTPVVTCPNVLPLFNICTITFVITQQSFGPTPGIITVTNQHINVLNDAHIGPLFETVAGNGFGGATVFQSTVSPAFIGFPAVLTSIRNGSALGVTATGPFTFSTKIQVHGKYITWQCHMDPHAVGEKVSVWMATKPIGGTTWSAFAPFSTRVVDSAGNCYFYYKSPTAKWVSIRFTFAGNAAHAAGSSLTRVAEFI